MTVDVHNQKDAWWLNNPLQQQLYWDIARWGPSGKQQYNGKSYQTIKANKKPHIWWCNSGSLSYASTITCACLAWLLSPVAFRAFCAFQKKLKEVQLVVEFQDATFFTHDVHWHLDVPAEINLRFPNSIAKSSFWRFPLCPSPPALSSPLWVHWRWPQGMPKWRDIRSPKHTRCLFR